MKTRYLVLSDGRYWAGEAIGADASASGELVFTTGMVGYLETLTDPAYAGQIVLQTFPMIGNYGVIPEDFEGKTAVKGYVVREICDQPSNFRCEGTLNDWLKEQGVCGIAGVDTRAITRILREEGTQNAMLCDALPEDLTALQAMENTCRAGCREKTVYPAAGEAKYRVTLVDFGVRKSVIDALTAAGCQVTAVPADTGAEAILAEKPDGVVLSGGPGDPADYADAAAMVKALWGKAPIFGEGLGHQIAALSQGAKTCRLPYGHRGANQPVRELAAGRTHITAQNHGYTVDGESLHGAGIVTHVNLNDGSCEGVRYPGGFTVQYTPARREYDAFIAMMEEKKHA